MILLEEDNKIDAKETPLISEGKKTLAESRPA